jgi:hypothetical protein
MVCLKLKFTNYSQTSQHFNDSFCESDDTIILVQLMEWETFPYWRRTEALQFGNWEKEVREDHADYIDR